MSDASSDSSKFDPVKAWRDWFVKNERDWSEAMTRYMKQEDVSDALGKEVIANLFRQQMMTEGLSGPMAMMNLPTRNDITALGDRIGRLEDAVARIEAALNAAQASAADAPARTRKPPSSGSKGT